MDIQKYIQSGILEDYVLGLISDSEAEEVEQNLVQYPALKTELYKIEDALASYAQAKAMPMPAGLSAQIIQSIEQLEAAPSPTSDTTPTGVKPHAAPSSGNNPLGIILGLALLGSLVGSFFLYQQKQTLQNQLVQSTTDLSAANEQFLTFQLVCDEKDQTIQRLNEQIAILKNPAYKPVTMKGTDKAPNIEAIVYFSPADGKTYLDIGNLPAAPSDKDYQLWAIVDGVPTDMKVIDLTTAVGGLIEVTHIQNPQAYAVTLETKGGNPAPNLEELYVIGNV